MELWIRSQDKQTFSKIKLIEVEDETKITGYNVFCVKLGEYKSKERALEVLDEIQRQIQPKIIKTEGEIIGSNLDDLVYRKPDIIDIKELSYIVYEMPEK